MEPIEPLDPELQTLFAGEHTHAPEQPFLSELARSLAVERRRRVFRSRVLRVAGLAAVMALSPWLIAGSQVASAKLDALFESAATWLATPAGWITLGLCALVALIARLWRRPSAL
jgi:hypothetical protein